MKVYLDDTRMPEEGWVLTKTPAETIKLLETGQVEELSLDHDLGSDETIGTGYDVLVWIEQRIVTTGFIPPEVIRPHTANPSAWVKMELAIRQIRRLAERSKLL